MKIRIKHDGEKRVCLAWRFEADAPRPVWVIRKFHQIGDAKKLEAIGYDGEITTANIGDWIVQIPMKQGFLLVVLPDEHFQKLTEPVEE